MLIQLSPKLLSVIALGASLFVAGCNKPADTSAKTTQEPAKTDKQELIIALDWVPNTNHTGLYVALENGYFKNQGFDVKIVQPSEDSASTLVANERADLGVYFQPNMVKRLNKGEPITAIGAIVQHNNAGLLSLKSLGASTPKDLHGKRYSTWEDPVDDKTVASLVGEPLNPIPGESTDATTALRMNQFDYILAYYSWDGIHAGLKGVETNFFYLKDSNPVFDYYSPVIIANSNALQKDPERYKKAMTAISQGYTYSSQHADESAEILIKHAPEINPELAKASQQYMSGQYLAEDGSWGRFDYNRWDNFFKWVYDNKLIDTPFAPQAGVSNDYLPNDVK